MQAPGRATDRATDRAQAGLGSQNAGHGAGHTAQAGHRKLPGIPGAGQATGSPKAGQGTGSPRSTGRPHAGHRKGTGRPQARHRQAIGCLQAGHRQGPTGRVQAVHRQHTGDFIGKWKLFVPGCGLKTALQRAVRLWAGARGNGVQARRVATGPENPHTSTHSAEN